VLTGWTIREIREIRDPDFSTDETHESNEIKGASGQVKRLRYKFRGFLCV
jgi:hypothetical protein